MEIGSHLPSSWGLSCVIWGYRQTPPEFAERLLAELQKNSTNPGPLPQVPGAQGFAVSAGGHTNHTFFVVPDFLFLSRVTASRAARTRPDWPGLGLGGERPIFNASATHGM